MSLTSQSLFNTSSDYFVDRKNPSNVLLDAGVIFGWATNVVPAGWALCNGQTLSATAYPDLFAKIGYTYGGSGDNFLVPDTRFKKIIGLGSLFPTVGATDGSENVVLTVANLPAHNHSVNDPGHQHLMRSQNNDGIAGLSTFCSYANTNQLATQVATTGITVNSTGGPGVIPTTQTFLNINYIIKLTNAGIIV